MRRGSIVVIGVALLVPACGGDEGPPPPCSDPVAASTIELADFEFRPACFTVETGAGLSLRNTGDAPHTFTVTGTGVDVDLDAGERGEVDLSGLDPGRYAVTCTFHPQMEATLTVA